MEKRMNKWVKGTVILALAVILLGTLAYFQRAELVRRYVDLPPYETKSGDTQIVQLAMRDGVKLATRVYRPAGDGPWPSVLIRDPYSQMQIFCRLLTRYGFACVHQDTRGRYDSEGEWYPVIHERHDGLDTLDWMIQQPWQNERIATYGGSYIGLVQWAMADALPKQVRTAVADISHGDWYQIVHRNGHFIQGIAGDWALGLHNSEAQLIDMAAHSPAVEANRIFLNGKKQWYHDYLTHPEKDDPYWNSEPYRSARNSHKGTTIPVLMSAAWHDFFLEGQLDVFEELPSRDNSLLIIRNGSHGKSSMVSFREALSFHMKSGLAWLNRHLKNLQVDSIPESGYLLQNNLNGSRESFTSWPEPGGSLTYYLTELSAASTCDGGKLANKPTENEDSVSYIYDPQNPVPSRGGANHFGMDIVDQGNDLCDRTDVLSFESPVLEKSTTILGNVQISLHLSSSAVDSAFTVKLQEKLADGQVLNIRDDISSLSFMNKSLSRQTYESGSRVDVTFDLTPIIWELRPGSSLRLDVSSSNHPIYNAHPNTEEPWYLGNESIKAKQTLFGGKVSIPLR